MYIYNSKLWACGRGNSIIKLSVYTLISSKDTTTESNVTKYNKQTKKKTNHWCVISFLVRCGSKKIFFCELSRFQQKLYFCQIFFKIFRLIHAIN